MAQKLLVSGPDLEKMTGKGRRTIYNWEKRGLLPPHTRVLNQKYWLVHEVADALKELGFNVDAA